MNTAVPVKKGEKYTIDIAGLGHSGEGVGRVEDFTVFVPLALPGERIRARITEVKKNYARGQLEEVIEPAPHRTKPRCSIFERCGGCQLQHLDYPGQLAAKRQAVVDAVTRIGKLPEIPVHPVIGTEDSWFYRNKMQFPVGEAGGRVAVGCFAQGTHDIIDTDRCFIQHDLNNAIAGEVRALLTELGIRAYNERDGQGVIRHVLGRVGTATGEVMVILVTATAGLPQEERIVARLRQRIKGLVSIVHNVNLKRTNIILGERTRTLWGRDTITDRLGEFVFRISPHSFFQVNTAQARVLYDKAVEYAGLSGKETVIDAYCGTGTITLFLARSAARVYGIEVVAAAVEDARQNARANGVGNVEFVVGDAVQVMPQLYRQGIRPHAVVVDPPRAGCEPQVLETFVRMQPERIVYVSCNPASLARDLALLAESGYQPREIQPVDMFPHTHHVECVVRLQRKHT
ncbi:MAG: 23S rRNA (uracil(1939)-C(5))-methyltransferase RlmD [Negativicutes bacterium]|nr:23S rRNA (uracil(1939)-C(5))-methyltransferase RlmD [Negativicutes bacterium]